MNYLVKQFVIVVVLFITIGVGICFSQEVMNFPFPQIPTMMIEPQQRATYLLMHYWDNVDFEDMSLVMDDEFMEQGFVDYLSVLQIVDIQTAEKSVETMMKRAEKSKAAYLRLVNIAEKYLFEPNSPMVNDEMYIIFLNQELKTTVLNKVEKARFEYQHKALMKNRVGSVATDFIYMDRDGKTGSLHEF